MFFLQGMTNNGGLTFSVSHTIPGFTITGISRLSTHFEPELLVRTLLILLFKPSDLMNHNGTRMNFEATRLTKAQRCEIIAKLSKPNAPGRRALGPKYEVSEGIFRKVWDNWENILQRIIC